MPEPDGFELPIWFFGNSRNQEANLQAEFCAPTGAPNRTTEMPHRDKRTNRLKLPLNGPVSDSVSNDLNRKHPANSRAFPNQS
jgi:hypothetical protein